MEKKYWQSFGALNQSDAYQKDVQNEFKEELPALSEDSNLLEAKTPRRDFLKYLGFSTAAAAVAASCEMPVKKAIPFVNKPENITPGVANYYATTYVQDGDVVSVLAKVRDGRPIKIEGNDLSAINGGGTSARAQASVLDLYDTARLRFPSIEGKEVTFEAVDKAVAEAMSGLTGSVVLLTSSIVSPSTKAVIAQFLAKYPGSKHVTYDAVSYSGMLDANQATYGKRVLPSYHFEKAKTIVSLGADFLGTWLSPVEFSKQYATGKRINEKDPSMSKHIHFESVATITGSNADEKYTHRPSETGMIAAALLAAVRGEAVNVADEKLKKGIAAAAKALNEQKGAALVVCGSNDPSVQIVVNAINEAVGANGTTINWAHTSNIRSGNDAEMAQLVKDMNAGSVGALLVYGANPAYNWYDAPSFIAGLKKVKVSISFNSKLDETTELCRFSLPDHHYLESWGDAEPKTNYFSFIQPTIHPLFKTRQWQDSLLKWSGATVDYVGYLKQFWGAKVGGEAGWNAALEKGVWQPDAPSVASTAFNGASVAAAVDTARASAKKDGLEVVLYQKVGIGEGQGASNPWLQELPDPVSRATWDNYFVIAPSLAKTLLGIDLSNGGQADAYEVNPPKKVIEVKVGNQTLSLPTLIIPGTDPNTIAVAVGYGRSAKTGKAAEGAGKNAYPLASFNGSFVAYHASNATATLTKDKYPVALTQTHFRYDTEQGNRTEVMKELTLGDFKKHPSEIYDERAKELEPWGGIEKFESDGTIYPVFDRPGIKWGMSVDLNTCTGCGACVVACNAENNIPVVGKTEVMRGHEMHWLRIDKYYSGDLDNPQVVFQPLMCQHCDNAPCENVCPVAATNHSSEGLNQMTYNRCIGTRYCANNCPYKVRRFNWADYTGSDSFANNQKGIISDVTMDMQDDLTRMVLNPDVTVRSRGVIEKCSFCVQRLQEGKLKAKKESRPLEDSDVKVACQQACPTNAIVFGNANNKESAITMTRMDNKLRTFFSLEMLHVLPNVNYMAKVRNTSSAHT